MQLRAFKKFVDYLSASFVSAKTKSLRKMKLTSAKMTTMVQFDGRGDACLNDSCNYFKSEICAGSSGESTPSQARNKLENL